MYRKVKYNLTCKA